MHRLLLLLLPLLPLMLAALAAPASALPLPEDPLQRECWLRHTRERTRVNLREPTAVDFSNLRRRHATRAPFQVDFAVRGMGVVPAGKPLDGAGHHHLLVDTALPLDIAAPIPFGDKHRHFGKGQTGVTLDLPPGRHRLRLLFADHDHKPYFVFSPEIEVTVTGARTATPPAISRANFEATCAQWYEDELARPRPPGDAVMVLNLRDGETVASPFNLRFGVEGYGVCAAGQSAERSGHFAVEVRQDARLVRSIDLSSGATQANLALPDGSYTLLLRFVDGRSGRELLPATSMPLVVAGQDRL